MFDRIMKKSFFSRFDWAAFWVATLVTFGVYFYTLGPSVGLEDSGELATASAHLGVPHPPGYPFWTFCTWIFCKIFSFVTYMGHPNPAWAVSCCSAVFGALAAGCTAMLISRSSSDFIFNGKRDSLFPEKESNAADWLSFAGGVGGALAFAFSPVEWSQSTIVEIYSLNSLFLMLVFLLSYRWMRSPSNKTLWFVAFVFGLGLTNYQVLLFAAVPLGIIIALKNFKLFRDFALFLIPVLLTFQVLKTGDYQRARSGMSSEVTVKRAPVGVSNEEYAAVCTEIGQYYGLYAAGEKEFSAQRKFLESELSNRKKVIAELKSEGVKIPSSVYKDCLALESEMKKMDSGERLARTINDEARAKLVNISKARKFYQRQLEGIDFKSVNGVAKEYLEPLGFGIQDLELKKDGKYRLKDAKLKDLERIVGGTIESKTDALPSPVVVVLSFIVFFASLIAAVFVKKRVNAGAAVQTVIGGSVAGAILLVLAGTLFSSEVTWTGTDAELYAPLANPIVYVLVGAFTMISVALAIAAAMREDETLFCGLSKRFIIASAVFTVMAIAVVFVKVPSSEGLAESFGYANVEDLPSYESWRSAVTEEMDTCTDKAVKAEMAKELDLPTDAYPSSATMLFLIVTLVALSVFVKKGLCFAIPVAGFQLALYLLLSRGAMHGLAHPSTWWFWWPLVWNFAVLALVWFVLPHGRSVAGAAFFAQLGLSFYAYMPIVSEFRNPPMNWGYPRTWDGFKHAITRGQYEEIKMPSFGGMAEFFALVKAQTIHYFTELKVQFSDYLIVLSLLPLACWRFTVRVAGKKISYSALWISCFFAILLGVRAISIACGAKETGALLAFDRLLLLLMAVPAVFGVLYIAFKQLLIRPAMALRRFVDVALREGRTGSLAVCAAVVAGALFLSIYKWTLPNGSPLAFSLCLTVLSVFGVAYFSVPAIVRFRLRESSVPTVSFDAGNLTQQWIIASGACFFVMTLPLILLADVKGDIQDGFIQKVKFISSHAMIAMWIGYGLVIFAAFAYLRLASGVKRRPALRVLGFILCAAILLGAGVTPVVKNYTDDEIVFRFGGSEQNGHTFGWQFGAYQLDGAKAIRAQITEDEEPLPDPDYPPPMDPYSVFFGGTDPGRFVPTYMIYGANFRPDIYLITQNALADGTYMAVERDLYGDEIWIPSEEDSAVAFQRYADRKGVSARNGRLQVTGALEVMEINAELAKMMHEHDRSRHSFYIEESYAMEWMYPYLSPHGLIMKINADTTAYDPALARKDRNFWDWYTRRLISDPMYRRDFAAQKSFSKLRASIAGLYIKQGRYADAATAFREAHLLYPASPEATFRYIGSYLLPKGRFETVRDLVEYTDKIDPNNKRTGNIKKYLANLSMLSRFGQEGMNTKNDEEWFAEVKKAGLTLEDSCALADAYIEFGFKEKAQKIMSLVAEDVLKSKNQNYLHKAAKIFLSTGRLDAAYYALIEYKAVADKPDVNLFVEWAILAHYYSLDGNSPLKNYRAETYRFFDFAAKHNFSLMLSRLEEYMKSIRDKAQDANLLALYARYKAALGYYEARKIVELLYPRFGFVQRDKVLGIIVDDINAQKRAPRGMPGTYAPENGLIK